MVRGVVRTVVDETVTVQEDISGEIHTINRSNIYGNHWTIGWHGSIIVDEELKETFFKAD